MKNWIRKCEKLIFTNGICFSVLNPCVKCRKLHVDPILLFFYYKTWSTYRGLHRMMNNNKTNVQVTVIHIILREEQRETEQEGEGEEGVGRKGKRRDSFSGSFLKDRVLLTLGNHYSDWKGLHFLVLLYAFLCIHYLYFLHFSKFLMALSFHSYQ